MSQKIQDLTIIGGGVMGLCTAYYASHFTSRITILEKSTIGNKKTASFGYTRSIRNDYLDPFYARLAYEARQLWLELQRHSAEYFLIECGCLNIAKQSITPDSSTTYAEQSYSTIANMHLQTASFDREALSRRYPQFDADLAYMDREAGFLYVPAVTALLTTALKAKNITIVEEVDIDAITQQDDTLHIQTSSGKYLSKKLIVTAGLGTNDLLSRIEGCNLQFPLRPDRPSQCKYFIPPSSKQSQFTTDALPVFAYLDVGIYGHPIYVGKTPGVKIGFYNPPDVKTLNTSIRDVHSFVNECMPSLADAEAIDVTDVDQCFYDLVADDNFILGDLPSLPNVYVGVGWRGTGYKYAPWVGKTLMQLALQGGTVYDIGRFTPQRFVSSTLTNRK